MKVSAEVMQACKLAEAAWSDERIAWSKLDGDPATLMTWWEVKKVATAAHDQFDQAIAGFLQAKRFD